MYTVYIMHKVFNKCELLLCCYCKNTGPKALLLEVINSVGSVVRPGNLHFKMYYLGDPVLGSPVPGPFLRPFPGVNLGCPRPREAHAGWIPQPLTEDKQAQKECPI